MELKLLVEACLFHTASLSFLSQNPVTFELCLCESLYHFLYSATDTKPSGQAGILWQVQHWRLELFNPVVSNTRCNNSSMFMTSWLNGIQRANKGV